jgi:pimeloyl-ACP methyl ester carboxylesterase
VPEGHRERARELDEKDMAGQATPEESLEAFSLVWPAYFADPETAPSMPHVELSQPASQGLWSDLTARMPALEASLGSISVPLGVLVGELSPMPPTAGTDTAEHVSGAWSHVEPGAGHFVWHEAPGCLLAAMDRLVGGA